VIAVVAGVVEHVIVGAIALGPLALLCWGAAALHGGRR
jgi:hypothetical protein